MIQDDAEKQQEQRKAESLLRQQLLMFDGVAAETSRQLADAQEESQQLSTSVAQLHHVVASLRDDIARVGPSKQQMRDVQRQTDEMNKTLIDTELNQTHETLRLLSERISQLVALRQDREKDLDTLARRICALQRVVLHPRGSHSSSSVKEIRTLQHENHHLRDQIAAIRAVESGPSDRGAATRTEIEHNLMQLQIELSRAERDVHIQTLSLEARIAEETRQIRVEHSQRVNTMIARHESTKVAAVQAARMAEEKELMAPKQLTKRALDGEDDSAPSKSTRNQDNIVLLTQERIKTTKVARLVANDIERNNELLDEHATLLCLVEKMAADVTATTEAMQEMTAQLDLVVAKAHDEQRNRDQWVKADAERLDQQSVEAVLNKEEELRGVKHQLTELQQLAEQLRHGAIHSGARPTTTSATSSAELALSPIQQQQQGAAASASSSPTRTIAASLKRSILLDV